MIRIVSVLTIALATTSSGFAQDQLPTETEAEMLGLKIHWIATAERFDSYIGDPSARLWPDSTAEDAYITLRTKSRVVARIDANQKNVEFARYGFYDANKGDKIAPLGIEGARKVADTIISQYKTLGRELIAEETVNPKTHLCAVSHTGGVQLFDAENGVQLWSTSVGDIRYPTVGPAIDDQLVGVVNGVNLYILDKANGDVLNKRELKSSASALPQAIGDKVFVPMSDGNIVAYPATDSYLGDAALRFTGALTVNPVVSASREFLAFPVANYLYTVRVGGKPDLWSRLQMLSDIQSPPVVLQDGMLVTSTDGTVLKLNYGREQNLEWRFNCGTDVFRRPVCNGQIAVIVSSTGKVIALDVKTGTFLWDTLVPGVSVGIAISDKNVYMQDFAGGIVSLSLADGSQNARLGRTLARAIPNEYSDRIYLRSNNGKIMCLREPDHALPIFTPSVAVMRGAAPDTDAPPVAGDSQEQDVLGEEIETDGGDALPGVDPFGGDNPFGGSDPTANPFGADADNPFGG